MIKNYMHHILRREYLLKMLLGQSTFGDPIFFSRNCKVRPTFNTRFGLSPTQMGLMDVHCWFSTRGNHINIWNHQILWGKVKYLDKLIGNPKKHIQIVYINTPMFCNLVVSFSWFLIFSILVRMPVRCHGKTKHVERWSYFVENHKQGGPTCVLSGSCTT
jgi:hypothetical protein